MDNLAALLIAILGGVGTSLVANILTRPKTKADAKFSEASAQVAVSEESRQWAQVFIDDAREAKLEAARANKRAAEAEQSSRSCERRMDDMEDRMEDLVDAFEQYVTSADHIIHEMGGSSPPVPKILLESLHRKKNNNG